MIIRCFIGQSIQFETKKDSIESSHIMYFIWTKHRRDNTAILIIKIHVHKIKHPANVEKTHKKETVCFQETPSRRPEAFQPHQKPATTGAMRARTEAKRRKRTVSMAGPSVRCLATPSPHACKACCIAPDVASSFAEGDTFASNTYTSVSE